MGLAKLVPIVLFHLNLVGPSIMAVLWILKLMRDGVRHLLTKMGSFNPLAMRAKEIMEYVRKVVQNMITQVTFFFNLAGIWI